MSSLAFKRFTITARALRLSLSQVLAGGLFIVIWAIWPGKSPRTCLLTRRHARGSQRLGFKHAKHWMGAMSQNLEAMARRTTSMQGIRCVVHTMKTLSVINAAPYEQAARAIDAYHDTVLKGLHAFLSQSGPIIAATGDGAARVVVVFGSDHGLCGNYNEALSAYVRQHLDAAKADTPATVLCVGAQMADALADQGLDVEKTFFPPASVDGIGRLANLLTQQLDHARRDSLPHEISVSLAYFARIDGGSQAAQIVPLLPLDPALVADLRAKPWVSRSLPYFSMPAADLSISIARCGWLPLP